MHIDYIVQTPPLTPLPTNYLLGEGCWTPPPKLLPSGGGGWTPPSRTTTFYGGGRGVRLEGRPPPQAKCR